MENVPCVCTLTLETSSKVKRPGKLARQECNLAVVWGQNNMVTLGMGIAILRRSYGCVGSASDEQAYHPSPAQLIVPIGSGVILMLECPHSQSLQRFLMGGEKPKNNSRFYFILLYCQNWHVQDIIPGQFQSH